MEWLINMIGSARTVLWSFFFRPVCAGSFWYHGGLIFLSLWQWKDLCDSGLICFLSSPSAPFLCHPNLWIRYGAVGFITVVAHQISTADIYCKLMPYLDPYITQPVMQVHALQLLPSSHRTSLEPPHQRAST